MNLKKINPEKFSPEMEGKLCHIETLGFKREQEKFVYGPISAELGRVIRCVSKQKEIVSEDKGTGVFETVPDTIVYELHPKPEGYHYTVIGCGAFRVFEL